ncbi:MAG TPA: DinB family protein [Acidimicrobiia bacterium]
MDVKHELIEQLAWHWSTQARPRLDGLTDDEYLWEPGPGAWSIRRRADATTGAAAGAGDWVADYEFPEPSPPPLTTIAWRLGHVAIGVFGMRASNHFGDGGVTYATTDWPPTAAGGLDLLDEGYVAWMNGLRGLDAADLARPCGPAEGPWSQHAMAGLVLHVNREAIHHLAEVALLRDLWRARAVP